MTPRTCFGVVVRSVGLLILLASLYHFLTGLWLAVSAGHSLVVSSLFFFFLYSGVGFLASLYLLRGAPHLVRFCYPDLPYLSSRPAA